MFYTKGEVYNKNELDDIVAHEQTINISGELSPEIPTVSDIINDANAHSVKISPNSVFTGGNVTSDRVFPFDSISNIVLYIREVFSSNANGILNHYHLGNIFGIYQSDNTYIVVNINGYTLSIKQYVNGTSVQN